MARARGAPTVDLSQSLRDDERGASAVEYAILVAAIAAVVTVVVIALGLSTADLFEISWP